MAAAASPDDIDVTSDVAVAISAFLAPHVEARQEQLDEEQLFFTKLFLCPHTGGVLFEPTTMGDGVTVNRAVLTHAKYVQSQIRSQGKHDWQLPVLQGITVAGAGDVDQPKINLMLRDVLLKVFPR